MASPQEAEQGGRIYAVAQQRDGTLILRFGNRSVDFSRVRSGDLVWRTHDPDLDKTVRPYLEASTPIAKQPISVRAVAREGSPLQTWLVSERSRCCRKLRVGTGQRLESRPDDGLPSGAAFGDLANTPYTLAELELDIEGAPFAPASVLNQIRREAVEQLQALQTQTRSASRAFCRIGVGGRNGAPAAVRLDASAIRNCIYSCVLPSSWKLPSRGDRRALRWTISICTA